jgi:hypothetical protein
MSRALARSPRPRHDWSVITLDEAQIWSIIGVLAATIVGMVTFGFAMLLRTMRAEIRSAVGGLAGETRSGFARVETRLDAMDRDINALMKRSFGIDRG